MINEGRGVEEKEYWINNINAEGEEEVEIKGERGGKNEQ